MKLSLSELLHPDQQFPDSMGYQLILLLSNYLIVALDSELAS